ncbi:hypothetical protein SAMN04489760_10169 [Syntrophus gentianae]|uniref:Glycoamylase-like domain-containing protein n=1 Tax=Syntrophus gentianae TaxID=43775 RepID=A0A1H7UBC0_9BACT|nr:glucoamylase family protein [Syntrophus gentianae]SEL93988.1 hypothetical protein SAMN04489760_10169 [Syntrophus gentianae]
MKITRILLFSALLMLFFAASARVEADHSNPSDYQAGEESDTTRPLNLSSLPAAGQNVVSQAVLIDFSKTNIVTKADSGINDFSGNMGALNKNGISYGSSRLVCSKGNSCAQQLKWDFSIDSDREAYTGIFYSLFGLTDTRTTFDGTTVGTTSFPEHSLDLDRIDGQLIEPDGPRKFKTLRIQLANQGTATVTLRVELKDTKGGGRFSRFRISAVTAKTLIWNFRDSSQYRTVGGKDLDLQKAKILSFVIERENIGDKIKNPLKGKLAIHKVSYVPDRTEVEPLSNAKLLDLLERRAAQYFIDWTSRKKDSLGIPQDRSTFGDLLTVGGIGFALPAYIISAERGWISRSAAISKTLSVLRKLDDTSSFGATPMGRIGYKGFFYHFLGVDGKRKLNYDDPATPTREDLNTVELSTIDTGLALMGVLAAQSYFKGSAEKEVEIRSLAQRIYNRVEWDFMLRTEAPDANRFYLGWKPNEERKGASFEIPDAKGKGKYSGTSANPSTLDYYTDEALIDILLAAGSTTHPIDAQAAYCALIKTPDENKLIRTHPGALFTYQFLRAFINLQGVTLPACPGEGAANWYANSQKAINTTIQYVESNPPGFSTYGPNAWGLSAAEGPDDQYRAYCAPTAAIGVPPQDGTVTYYGMISSVSSGTSLKTRAIQALRNAWKRKDWHYRFSLPDAFNDNISQAGLAPVEGNPLLRKSGPWMNRQLFAIDQGPMLLHLENARSGLIWNLLAKNRNIKRGLDRLRTPLENSLQEEDREGEEQER